MKNLLNFIWTFLHLFLLFSICQYISLCYNGALGIRLDV